METKYAFIKDNNVITVALFDDPSEDLLNTFKQVHEVDYLILADDKAETGGTYDGTRFWRVKPFPSWVKNEEASEWEAPIPYPTDGKTYVWDEPTLSWKELVLPIA